MLEQVSSLTTSRSTTPIAASLVCHGATSMALAATLVTLTAAASIILVAALPVVLVLVLVAPAVVSAVVVTIRPAAITVISSSSGSGAKQVAACALVGAGAEALRQVLLQPVPCWALGGRVGGQLGGLQLTRLLAQQGGHLKQRLSTCVVVGDRSGLMVGSLTQTQRWQQLVRYIRVLMRCWHKH